MPGAAPDLRAQVLGGLRWRALMAIAGGAGGFLTIALTARLLSPGEFTPFLLSTSLVAVVPTLVRAGFGGSALIRVTMAEAQGDPAGARVGGWSLFIGALGVAPLVAAAASCGVLLGHPTQPLATVVLLAALLLVESLRLVASDLLLSLHRQRAAALSGYEVRVLLTVPVFVALVLLNPSIGLAGVLGVIWIVSAPLTVLGLRRLLSELGPRPMELDPLRMLLPSAGPFVIIAFANFAVARGDLWFASAGLEKSDAAAYGAASTLAVQLLLPLAVAGQAMAPVVSHLWAQGRTDDLERLLRRSATGVAVLAGAAGLTVAAAGRPLLELIYGSGYGKAALPLAILSAGAVLTTGAGAVSRTLALCVGPGVAARAVTAGATVTVALLGLGAWVGSPVALAIASSAGMVITYGAQVVVVHRRIGIWTVPALSRRGRRRRPVPLPAKI